MSKGHREQRVTDVEQIEANVISRIRCEFLDELGLDEPVPWPKRNDIDPCAPDTVLDVLHRRIQREHLVVGGSS